MDNNTEGQLKILLNGGGLNDDSIFCDFSLTAQHEVLGMFIVVFRTW